MSDAAEPGLWARKRSDARIEITDTALRLFAERGFDATTIDHIVAEVGISRRSFFRYFGTKEDIVFGDLAAVGLALADALEAQPLSVLPWDALRAAFLTLRPDQKSAARDLEVQLLLRTSASLRARHMEKHQQWLVLLVPNVARRLLSARSPESNATLAPDAATHAAAHALVSAMLACLDSAFTIWAERGGDGDLVELYDAAVEAVRG